MAGRDDFEQTAKGTPFNNTGTGITSNPKNVRSAILDHVERHNPGGDNAIATATASQLTPDLANAEGNATSVARSNHIHNVPTAAAITISTNGTNTQGNASTFARSNHTHKSEIYYQTVSISNEPSTTSSTDVLMPDMTITPPAGTYLVFFGTGFNITGNNNTGFASIYVGGTQVPNSERQIKNNTDNARNLDFNINISGFPVTVNGSQAIEIRWRRNGGTLSALNSRHLTVMRVN